MIHERLPLRDFERTFQAHATGEEHFGKNLNTNVCVGNEGVSDEI